MKRLFPAALLLLCLGSLLLLLSLWLPLPRPVLAGAVLAVVGALVFHVLYYRFYRKKLRALLPLLDAGRVEEYLLGVKALLGTAWGVELRSALYIALAAGYTAAQRPDRALEVLAPLSQVKLMGTGVRLSYQIGLCADYFYSGQTRRALACYQAQQPFFAPYRQDPVYAGHLAALDILAAIQSGRYEQAEQLLASAQKAWDLPRLQTIFAASRQTLELERQRTPALAG